MAIQPFSPLLSAGCLRLLPPTYSLPHASFHPSHILFRVALQSCPYHPSLAQSSFPSRIEEYQPRCSRAYSSSSPYHPFPNASIALSSNSPRAFSAPQIPQLSFLIHRSPLLLSFLSRLQP